MFRSYKTLAVVILLGASVLTSKVAAAKSVKDFEALPTEDQNAYLITFLEKMTNDIERTNAGLARDIRDYFGKKQAGKPFSEGLEKVFTELTALEREEKAGKADLSKIQIETIIVYVVKQKFPPPAR